jgi:hypothetical protein
MEGRVGGVKTFTISAVATTPTAPAPDHDAALGFAEIQCMCV